MKKTIFELYNVSRETPAPLLSNFDADFWQEYITNYEDFDKFYMHLYKSYEYYMQLPNETVEEIQDAFTQDVYMLLMKNSKKYSEIWRVVTIPDNDAYELTNNYDIHETYNGTESAQGAATTGQRTDITYDNIGSQNSAGANKVTGWDSSSENAQDSNTGTIGSRQDTHQFTKGQEEDTSRTQGQDHHESRRWGSLGVMTVDDILKKHVDFWNVFDFYQMIFNDICKELLLIGGDSIW